MIRLLAVAALLLVQDPPKPQEPGKTPEQPAPKPLLALKVTKEQRAAPDGVTITADRYHLPYDDSERPLFVCFHMENGSRAEFAKIAQLFGDYACATLAVDLRTGKETDGVANETAVSAENVLKKKDFKNEDAFVDVVTALKWARETHPRGQIFALGSGTSAALVIAAVARNPETADALFLFSPGEDVPGWSIAVEAKQIAVPSYLTCAGTAEEAARARPIGHALGKKAKVVIPLNIPTATRGSTVLVQADDNLRVRHWSTIITMLRTLAPVAAPASTEPPKKS